MRPVKIVSKKKTKFAQDLEITPHHLTSDANPESDGQGGDDLGPTPHELLSAALGACTAITVKMYATRKKWPLEDCEVQIEQENTADGVIFRKMIKFHGPLDEVQRNRLLEIGNHCPVHKTLTGKISIETKQGGSKDDDAM